jgi:hypothetical protein
MEKKGTENLESCCLSLHCPSSMPLKKASLCPVKTKKSFNVAPQSYLLVFLKERKERVQRSLEEGPSNPCVGSLQSHVYLPLF